MRITLQIDSANGEEAHRFIASYQRSRHAEDIPYDQDQACEARIVGIGFTVTTPPMHPDRARRMTEELWASVEFSNRSVVSE